MDSTAVPTHNKSVENQTPSAAPPRKFVRRWRLVIYPKFQFTLVGLNAGLISGLFLLFLLFQSRSYSQLTRMGEAAHLGPNHPFFQLLDLQMSNMRFHMSIAFVCAVILGSFMTLVASQKLAGPVVRMKGFFTRLADQGKVTERLSFRAGDYFLELPAEVNRALESLTKKP